MSEAMIKLHPSQRLVLPWGGTADIDLDMVPLVRVLWEMDLRTEGSCQDLGESTAVVGGSEGRERFARYYQGQAWLKMPAEDGKRMLNRLAAHPRFRERFNRWTRPDAWESYVYLLPGDTDVGLSAWAQIHFPRGQIAEVVEVLVGGPEACS